MKQAQSLRSKMEGVGMTDEKCEAIYQAGVNLGFAHGMIAGLATAGVLLLIACLFGCSAHRPPQPRCPADSSLGRHSCAEVHPLDVWDEETEADLVHGRDCRGERP